jgi:murein DD-endopeptidase MepM/ murein hydrolase activator NlpD
VVGYLPRQIKASDNKYFSFIIVPHSASGNVYTFRAPKWAVLSSLLVLLLCFVVVSSSVIYTSSLSRRLLHYRMTLQINEEQKRQIDYFSDETSQVKQAITELIDRDNELRRMLGIEVKKPRIDLSGVVASTERLKLGKMEPPTEAKISRVASDLFVVDASLKERSDSLDALKEKVKYVKTRFAHTPSIWPTYGRIVSMFGYRYTPWRGFHTGLDVATWYGAPIRAAADGVVTWSGWRGGYGKAMMIDHGYGLVSLYGHCSRLLASLGTSVKKGQIIAYVGATGLATGPHVHYEVRRSGSLINPVSYLNLDIFTASRVWSK